MAPKSKAPAKALAQAKATAKAAAKAKAKASAPGPGPAPRRVPPPGPAPIQGIRINSEADAAGPGGGVAWSHPEFGFTACLNKFLQRTRHGLDLLTLSRPDAAGRPEMERRLEAAIHEFREASYEWKRVDAHVMGRILATALRP